MKYFRLGVVLSILLSVLYLFSCQKEKLEEEKTKEIEIKSNLDFGGVPVDSAKLISFTIKNIGTGEVNISNIIFPKGYLGDWNNGAISSGEQLLVNTKFSPTDEQDYSGQIVVKSNAISSPDFIQVSGNGIVNKAQLSVSPSSLTFGDVTLGNFATKTFTISNTGKSSLSISNISVPSSVFSFTYNKSIPGNSSQEIIVKFTPVAAQNYSGSITILTNAGSAQISVSGDGKAAPAAILGASPNLLEFGDVTIGNYVEKIFTISNTGNAPLTINNIILPNSVYSLSYNRNVDPGKSQQITVKFAPIFVSSYSGTINIKTNVGDAGVVVTGKGITQAKPVLAVELTSIDFGSLDITNYQFTYKTFHLYNRGNAPLTISSVQSGNNVFTTPNFTTPTVIAANSSQLIEVRFTPTGIGNYNSSISIQSDGGNISIPVSGQGIGSAKISVSPYSLNFDNVPVGSYNTRTLKISNAGSANLSIDRITVPSSMVFTLNYSKDIAAGSSQTIEVKFTPAVIQTYSGTILIESNAGNVQIPVTGNGIVQSQPILDVETLNLNFGNVNIGSSQTITFLLYNRGGAPLTITGVYSENNAFSFPSYSTPSVINAYSSELIMAKFSPQIAGTYNNYLHIVSNGGNKVLSATGVGIGASCNPVSSPPLGFYPNACDNNNNAYGYISAPQTGIIEAGIVGIDCINHKITFQFKRCDGKGFIHEGSVYVFPTYDGYQVTPGWGPFGFSQGDMYQNITITDNNMTGTKTYYIKTWQDPNKYPEVNGGWAVSNAITVTY